MSGIHPFHRKIKICINKLKIAKEENSKIFKTKLRLDISEFYPYISQCSLPQIVNSKPKTLKNACFKRFLYVFGELKKFIGYNGKAFAYC
jgi:hypothetical protein